MKLTGLPKARLLIVTTAALLAVAAAVATAVRAATPTATATLTAASPSIYSPTSSITLSGQITGAPDDYISDNTAGDQLAIRNADVQGWHITATAGAFTCTTGACMTGGADTFSGMSLTTATSPSGWNDVTAITPGCSGSCVSATNTNTSATGWGTDLSGGPITLYTDDAGKGIGQITFGTEWWIQVPGGKRAGTYTSTVTLNIIAP